MTEETKKSPSHVAYQVKEGSGDRSYWTRVGAVFQHNDGKGFNLVLDAMPFDGRITLREPSEKPEGTEG
jgi:hypothetical protein